FPLPCAPLRARTSAARAGATPVPGRQWARAVRLQPQHRRAMRGGSRAHRIPTGGREGLPQGKCSMSGLCVLVTGASGGIGRAIALRMAQDGFDVAVHCRSRRDEAERLAEEIRAMGRESRVLQFDVGDRGATASALLADVEAHGCYYGI